MSKVLLALTSAALLGLSGCADMQTTQAPPAKAAVPAKVSISAEAQAALTAAKAEAKDAKAKNHLWTTADNALKEADEAAAKGDSDTVMTQVKLARDHIQKGLAQMNYPMIKVGD